MPFETIKTKTLKRAINDIQEWNVLIFNENRSKI